MSDGFAEAYDVLSQTPDLKPGAELSIRASATSASHARFALEPLFKHQLPRTRSTPAKNGNALAISSDGFSTSLGRPGFSGVRLYENEIASGLYLVYRRLPKVVVLP